MSRGNPHNLSGVEFGDLTAIEIAGKKGRQNLWLCKCKCGNDHKVSAHLLVSGRSKSCGCKRGVRHGFSKTPEYRAYMAMRARCNNPKNPEFKNYGDRGIKVCARWEESFLNFYEDLGPRPSKAHSIDRMDVEKGYSKENCRWATLKEQNSNKRQTIWVSAYGETLCLTEMATKHGINPQTLKYRLKTMSAEEALEKEVVYAGR